MHIDVGGLYVGVCRVVLVCCAITVACLSFASKRWSGDWVEDARNAKVVRGTRFGGSASLASLGQRNFPQANSSLARVGSKDTGGWSMRAWLQKRTQINTAFTGRTASSRDFLRQSTSATAGAATDRFRYAPQKRQAQQRDDNRVAPQRLQRSKDSILKPTASWPDSAQSIRTRHLLRAILRECTYLPDSHACQWVTRHAISRFRDYSFRAWQHRDDREFELRLRAKEKEARSAAVLLRRANQGERKCVMRVLLMAYGRIGKRRHELMRPLLPVKQNGYLEAAEDESNSLEINLDDGVEGGTRTRDLENRASRSTPMTPDTSIPMARNTTLPLLTPPLRALLRSQIQASPPTLTRTNPRRIDPVIPELNTWLRPMPRVRVKNMQKKHYALLLDRVLPPLPTAEWNRLRDLASGKVKPAEPVPRRKRDVSIVHSSVAIPTATSALEMVVKYGKVPMRPLGGRRNPHTMTPRFMRRLYVEVFSQCPLMNWDAEGKQWKVVWGLQALHGASAADMAPVETGPDSDSAEPDLEGEIEEGPYEEPAAAAG